jgi:SAM-dependent methyltransferase
MLGIDSGRRVEMTTLEQVALLQQAILRDAGASLDPGRRVLDIGCGNGALVKAWLDAGHDAYGCDFRFKEGPHAQDLAGQGRIRLVEQQPYRLPFDDASFDILVTNQVMEHVRDYPATIREMRRVVKPGGVTLHMFPSRWRPIESHVRVPLSSVWRNMAWLSLWALLGVRTPGQSGMTRRQVAQSNRTYLQDSTNYLSGRAIRAYFKSCFSDVRHAKALFLRNTPNQRGRALHALGQRILFLYSIYRLAWSRTVLAR